MRVLKGLASGLAGEMGLVTAVLVALKVTGLIAWSWWWIMIPVWIGPAFVIVACLVMTMIFMLLAVCG